MKNKVDYLLLSKKIMHFTTFISRARLRRCGAKWCSV